MRYEGTRDRCSHGRARRPRPYARADPQLRHRNMIVGVRNPASGAEMFVTGNPVKLSTAPDEIGPPPARGEHNAEIYRGLLGLDEERLRALEAEKIV